MEDAVAQLAEAEWGFDMKKDKEEGKEEEEGKAPKDPYTDLKPYANRERESVSGFIPGAIYKVHLDKTHPWHSVTLNTITPSNKMTSCLRISKTTAGMWAHLRRTTT